jgi:hypothetical protein
VDVGQRYEKILPVKTLINLPGLLQRLLKDRNSDFNLSLMEKPQIVLHSQKSLDYTPFDIKWIPQSPRYISLGQLANGTGIIEIRSLQGSIKRVFLEI